MLEEKNIWHVVDTIAIEENMLLCRILLKIKILRNWGCYETISYLKCQKSYYFDLNSTDIVQVVKLTGCIVFINYYQVWKCHLHLSIKNVQKSILCMGCKCSGVATGVQWGRAAPGDTLEGVTPIPCTRI